MILLDVGNGRVKWGWWDGSNVSATGAKTHRGRADWAAKAAVHARYPTAPDEIWVANVAGDRFQKALVDACRQRWKKRPRFVAVSQSAGKVTCGYDKISRLGVDRWVAVLAAFHRFGASIVVDAGTALTIDGVTGAGDHLGGVIVPGRRLMAKALDQNTSDIGTVDEMDLQRIKGLGRTTDEAVRMGALFALAGSVNTVRERLSKTLPEATIVLTGGDGPELLPLLEGDVEHRPHLVLEGLTLFAQGSLG